MSNEIKARMASGMVYRGSHATRSRSWGEAKFRLYMVDEDGETHCMVMTDVTAKVLRDVLVKAYPKPAKRKQATAKARTGGGV